MWEVACKESSILSVNPSRVMNETNNFQTKTLVLAGFILQIITYT